MTPTLHRSPRSPLPRWRPLPAFLALLLSTTTAWGAGPGSTDSTDSTDDPPSVTATFEDVTEVKVINVEAVVTDRQGIRVFGLDPDDFELLVDGQPVDIEYFTEIRGGQALRDDGRDRDVAPVSAGQARGTSYLVFVDDFFSLASDRDRVLSALESELDYLGEEDRMAIVAWDGQQVDMLQSWTDSPRDLGRALRRAEDRPAGGLHRRSERLTFDQGIVPVGSRAYRGLVGPATGRALDVQQRAYTDMLFSQLDRMIAAASATMRGFAEPEGRKVMLLLSGGWPFAPADFVAGNPFQPVYTYPYPRDAGVYQPLVEAANLIGYTLYPVDVPGLQATAGGVERSFYGTRGDIGFYRENENQYTLYYLANQTGGRASINGQRDRPLERVVTDTRSFYWLGFTPDWKEDGSEHEVEVRLADPKLRVRSRSGYTDLTRDQRVAMAVESALVFGSAASEDGLEVELGPSRKAGIGRMEVPLELRLPADLPTLLPQGTGYAAELEVRIAAMDPTGALSDVSREPFRVELANAPTPGEEIDWQTTLRMRRREHDLVVAVYDSVSGELWSSRTFVARPE